MSNAIYDKYKEALLSRLVNTDLLTEDVKAVLVDLADYTFSQAHDFLDDVPAGARVATSPNLTTKTVANGVFDCDNWTWTAVTGDQSEAVIVYVDTGAAATSRLVTFIDTSVTNLPVTPNGGNITFQVDAAGVFKL